MSTEDVTAEIAAVLAGHLPRDTYDAWTTERAAAICWPMTVEDA